MDFPYIKYIKPFTFEEPIKEGKTNSTKQKPSGEQLTSWGKSTIDLKSGKRTDDNGGNPSCYEGEQ